MITDDEMENQHRQALRKNRTKLIENVGKPDEVSDKLWEKEIFTVSMKQEVDAVKTDNDKIRKILDILPRRGPHAFSAFITVLRETKNDFAADLLCSGDSGAGAANAGGGATAGTIGVAIASQGVILPEVWPDEASMTEEIQVRACNVHSDLVMRKWLSEDVYPMRKQCRGRCIVISNKVFYGPLQRDKEGKMRVILENRYGTEKDEEDLKKLFTQLQFNVTIHRDKTAAEMFSILEEEAKHTDHQRADSFVCIICSHGTREGIYGVDGGKIQLDSVTSFFDGDHCQALIRKPKIFFIQACQGETVDVGLPADSLDGISELAQEVERLTLHNRTDAERDQAVPIVRQRSVPAKLDILVACATHPGYVSLRNVSYGSWFIQAVIFVFQRFACEKHLSDLLTMVNRLVAKGRTPQAGAGEAPAGQIMMAAVYNSSLNKDLYFFPGIVES